jgi:polysaccharide biosynthesis/export protein
MPDHFPPKRSLKPLATIRVAGLRWQRATSVRMIIGGVIALAIVFLTTAVIAHAQSSAIFQSSPSSPTLQTFSSPSSGLTSPVIPSATTAPPEFRVGVGDVLGITVYNMPELDRTAVVGANGALLLSYFPRPVGVGGKTAQDIGQEVASELRKLQILVDPQVSVAVLQVESKPVVVGGSVRNPQVLQEVRPLSLQQALMLAGGPESGAGNSVLVTRAISNEEMVSYALQLSKVLSGTDSKSNIPIKPGDTIQVLPDQNVFVAGDVKNPGAFPLGRGQSLTVSKLMALTHGWKADAKPAKAVIVREGANGQRQTLPIDLPKIMARKQPDVTLEANDLLYVPDSTGKTVELTALKGVGGAAMLGLGYLIIHP